MLPSFTNINKYSKYFLAQPPMIFRAAKILRPWQTIKKGLGRAAKHTVPVFAQ